MNEQSLTQKYPLLIEMGVEEIPSNVIAPTLKQLSEQTDLRLSAARMDHSSAQVYGTPRRLILFMPELTSMQETQTEWIIGPPQQAAFDASGHPTPAADGFAKSQGAPLSALHIERVEQLGEASKGKKGPYLVYKKVQPGETTESLLSRIIPEIMASLHFPRSMRWNDTGTAFVRPIRSIVALYGGRPIPFSFAGVSSGDLSHGHHIMAPEAFQVRDFESYRTELARRFVVIDPEERVRIIAAQMEALAKEKKGGLDLSDQSLLWEAAYTVESPKAICGNFDRAFLDIPKEIIITAMGEHQGYFPLYGADGTLLPHFITISNIETADMSIIQKGNERVLRARLVDAQFYFDQDRKQTLSEWVNPLQRVTFQEALGSVREKVGRLTTLAVFISKETGCPESETLSIERAAHLCKADLISGVVREFTSLQGTMGRIYATLDGEDPKVAKAIEEHYLPRHAGGLLPKTLHGGILALTDKLDTLVGCFGVGLIPSGSEDPYALRRQGLGLIQIILSEAAFHTLSIQKTILEAIRQYEAQDKFSGEALLEPLLVFLKQRLDSLLQSEGVRYDLREAVLINTIDQPSEIVKRAKALMQFTAAPLFKPLMTAFKRAIRILPAGFEGKTDPALLNEPAERKLHETLKAVQQTVSGLWADRKYVEILESLSTLFDPLNNFFNAVMVMDKNEAVRHNRLSLLFEIQQQFAPFADFSKIVEDPLTP